MAIKMVREPSETANITNIDDIIPFRHAYGNINGYVKNRANELSYTVNGSNFVLNSGRVVLQGVECDIDASGVTITVDNIAETRYYVIYLKVNLGTNTATIQSDFSTSTYPTISAGDDLIQNTSGVANLVLYKFTALSGVISNVTKVVSAIPYPLQGYDGTKGTIEERLTNLGFKQGSIQLASGITAITNVLKRQGNYVLGTLRLPADVPNAPYQSPLIGTVPSDFLPKEQYYSRPTLTISYGSSGSYTEYTLASDLSIATNGEVSVNRAIVNVGSNLIRFNGEWEINFGYEANPIT